MHPDELRGLVARLNPDLREQAPNRRRRRRSGPLKVPALSTPGQARILALCRAAAPPLCEWTPPQRQRRANRHRWAWRLRRQRPS